MQVINLYDCCTHNITVKIKEMPCEYILGSYLIHDYSYNVDITADEMHKVISFFEELITTKRNLE
jgi:hypothetical protein